MKTIASFAVNRILIPLDSIKRRLCSIQFAKKLAGDHETQIVVLGEDKQAEDSEVSNGAIGNYFEQGDPDLAFSDNASDFIKNKLNSAGVSNYLVILEDLEFLENLSRSEDSSLRYKYGDNLLFMLSPDYEENESTNIAFICEYDTVYDASKLVNLWSVANVLDAQVHIVFTQKTKGPCLNQWIDETERILDYYLHAIQYRYSVIDSQAPLSLVLRLFKDHDIVML